jgi:hypothetical protein
VKRPINFYFKLFARVRRPLVKIVMLAKLRGHVGPRDGAGRACRCSVVFVMLGIARA